MRAEYVGLNGTERYFGQGSLLKAQLELLGMIRSFQVYTLLRKEELLLKVSLKMKIEEVQKCIADLEKLFPKTIYSDPYSVGEEKVEKKSKEELDLQSEIESIKRKLQVLNTGLGSN